MKPLRKVCHIWSSNFAYAVGLFTSDGCLSPDGRHLEFNSKDEKQVKNFKKCLNLFNKITKKARSDERIKKYYRVQFGDTQFYKFLESIGLSPRKSKSLRELKIPKIFFPDFLRGLFDGDGCFRVFVHPESQYPQLRVSFASASPKFVRWLQQEINRRLDTKGFIETAVRAESLTYAIKDSIKLLNFMYYSPNIVCLPRKFEKVKSYLRGRSRIGIGA
ncbi:MAG: LAGLIDADG family homing endonuclease [Patescibacteria group bacterium]